MCVFVCVCVPGILGSPGRPWFPLAREVPGSPADLSPQESHAHPTDPEEPKCVSTRSALSQRRKESGKIMQ